MVRREAQDIICTVFPITSAGVFACVPPVPDAPPQEHEGGGNFEHGEFVRVGWEKIVNPMLRMVTFF